jgi:hypothetical protein
MTNNDDKLKALLKRVLVCGGEMYQNGRSGTDPDWLFDDLIRHGIDVGLLTDKEYDKAHGRHHDDWYYN